MSDTRTGSGTPTTTSRSTTTPTSTKSTTTTPSSSSTRVRAREGQEELAQKTLVEMSVETIRTAHMDIFGRPMPRWTENQLRADLEAGTPAIYYRYALGEAANAPYPSWRYALAIIARLKREHVEPDDLLLAMW